MRRKSVEGSLPRLQYLQEAGIVFFLQPSLFWCSWREAYGDFSFVAGNQVLVSTWRKVLYYFVCSMARVNVIGATGAHLIGLNDLSIVLLWQIFVFAR